MELPRRDTLARLPLAEAVLTLWRWVADSGSLDQIFDDNRGRCYEKILSFSLLVYLIRDALLEYGGSGRKSFDEAKERGELETSFRAAYGKLGRIPIPVSSAMLAGCTARLREVYPGEPQAQTPLPASLDDYRVITLDGKAIKRVAKRLKPLWGVPGGLLGGRALVAMDMPAVWPWRCAPIPTAMRMRSALWAIWCPKCGARPGEDALGPATVGSAT